MLETYLKQYEMAYFELGEAFKGLKDENVWKRPAPGLLSVGELTGHIAYWEAVRLAGDYAEGRERSILKSPLIHDHFRYFPQTLQTSVSEELLAMTAEQVGTELQRLHGEVMAHFLSLKPDLAKPIPGGLPDWPCEETLKYQLFHIAYHTGQMYSARHLLGEETVDN